MTVEQHDRPASSGSDARLRYLSRREVSFALLVGLATFVGVGLVLDWPDILSHEFVQRGPVVFYIEFYKPLLPPGAAVVICLGMLLAMQRSPPGPRVYHGAAARPHGRPTMTAWYSAFGVVMALAVMALAILALPSALRPALLAPLLIGLGVAAFRLRKHSHQGQARHDDAPNGPGGSGAA